MMKPNSTEGTTPLTEQQARSLAHWWGGEYREIPADGAGQGRRHGVLVTGTKSCRPRRDETAPVLVFSLEEAREMENRRDFQEACNPDWVG